MSTTDHTLLIILDVLISVFFLMLIAILIGVFQLVKQVKRVVAKAEEVVTSVEEAAEVLRDTGGKFAFLKLINNIMKMAKGKK
jgi:H+/gluconate symporter-like permease